MGCVSKLVEIADQRCPREVIVAESGRAVKGDGLDGWETVAQPAILCMRICPWCQQSPEEHGDGLGIGEYGLYLDPSSEFL